MYKKLDQSMIRAIMETGIDEFARCGLDRANINTIAKKAGVSVGVIYKYFSDKNGFFLECLKYSLGSLDEVLQEAAGCETDVLTGIRRVVQALIKHALEHPNHNAMYNEISSGGCKQYAAELAREIEGKSAQVYARLLENARAAGKLDTELDSRTLAFFIDNLFMMLQFSYSCDYYRERARIFCGEDALDNTEKMTEEFMRFVRSALKA